jgi:Tol biopolymer transport system component
MIILVFGFTVLPAVLITDMGFAADARKPGLTVNTSAENADKEVPAEEGEPPEINSDIEPETTKHEFDGFIIPLDSEQEKPESIVVETVPDVLEPLHVRTLLEIESGRNDSNPVFSPSGELIAFERSIGDKQEIIVSRLDGSVVHKIYCKSSEKEEEMGFFLPEIVDDASYNAGISWSPDEKSLVFMSNGGGGNYDLYLLPELGSETTIRLTEHEEKDSHPHWSPVSDHFVFVSGRTGTADIFLMDLVSRKAIRLTQGQKTHLYPQWSPDGKKIVMIYGSNENHDIYLIGDITRPIETLKALTTWVYDDLRPAWSPDGKKIAFYSNYNLEDDPKVWSIIVIAADGSDPAEGEALAAKVVATNIIPDIERGPAWISDSNRIIYIKNDKQAYNPIYIVDVDNKTNLPIRTDTKMNHDVVCSPDGNIAFRAQVEQWDHIFIMQLKQ